MKVEDNHYKYRIETKDSNGSVIDFVDIDTVEPLRCAYDVQDELNLETNEHVKRVEEIILNADSTEFWYVDEDRSTDTHLVCYFEEVQLMANADHPMVDTDRSLFEYGKINANEYQDTNFICTHVMPNGVSRIYMSIDKDQLLYQVFTNETIKEYIAQNPITIWYAIRYPVSIPRSMSKGHLLTLDGQTDVSISTNGKEVGLPLVKFNIGETQYNMDNNPIHLSSTTEGTQIRNIVLEGNTPINYARGNGVNTTEATSNTRYDFAPFYDGQTTISNTVEGGYVSAKLYGDTMVNIAKPYGETPLLTATNASTLCDDLLGVNEEGIVLADGEITEGRIIGDSIVNYLTPNGLYVPSSGGNTSKSWSTTNRKLTITCVAKTGTGWGGMQALAMNNTQKERLVEGEVYTLYFDIKQCTTNFNMQFYGTSFPVTSSSVGSYRKTFTYNSNNSILFTYVDANGTDVDLTLEIEIKLLLKGNYEQESPSCVNDVNYFEGIGSVVNPTVYSVNENLVNPSLFRKGINISLVDGGVMVDGDTSVGWQSFYNNTTAIKLLANHTYKLRAFLLEGEYTGGNFKYSLSNNTAKETPYTNTFTITPTTDAYLTALSFYAPKGVGAKFGISLIETNGELDTYIPYKSSQFTSTHTLNKLPNGVADYIDVVNKVHVQRVGVFVADGADTKSWSIGTFSNSSVNTECTIFSTNISDKLNNWNINHKICDKWSLYNTDITSNDIANIEGVHSGGNADSFFINVSNTKATTVEQWKTYLQSNPFTYLYELKTPIYTPLTDEEITQLPLSAYKDGYVMLSSDQLMPSFEFRMKASNRYQVDMLETGYYYLNAPVGSVKLGTANVDVQQMPCIVKVDNVGTGDSGYRLGFNGGNTSILSFDKSNFTLGYYYGLSGELLASGRDCAYEEYIPISTGDSILINQLYYTQANPYSVSVILYDSNKTMIKQLQINKATPQKVNTANVAYFRFSCIHDRTVTEPTTKVAEVYINPITLAKLPSHRIPTSFTQGMKCTTDFGYWEGIKEAQISMYRTYKNAETKDRVDLSKYIELNRIEYGNTIVEDEFDIATGKLTKRVGIMALDGSENWKQINDGNTRDDEYVYTYQIKFADMVKPNFKPAKGVISNRHPYQPSIWDFDKEGVSIGGSDVVLALHKEKAYSLEALKQYLATNPLIIYYELEVPEISYVDLPLNTLRALDATTTLQVANQSLTNYLLPQVKPSHLTYPVPSLVGNRTYTVVHNRKNIDGSTKPIILDLGGTQVELNNANGKTLVKTPSTLKHSSLIFIGGESTVDHIMVLDGDWTNKPIEYFENMKGHDTDAIITIIGDGKIDDVAEQYLW